MKASESLPQNVHFAGVITHTRSLNVNYLLTTAGYMIHQLKKVEELISFDPNCTQFCESADYMPHGVSHAFPSDALLKLPTVMGMLMCTSYDSEMMEFK